MPTTTTLIQTTVESVLAAVAAALGDGWRVVPWAQCARPCATDGRVVVFAALSAGRWTLSARPAHSQGYEALPSGGIPGSSISVAGDTPAERVAAHAARRLRPCFDAMGEAHDRAVTYEENDRAVAALARRLAETCSTTPWSHEASSWSAYMGDDASVKGRVHGPDCVDLELHRLTADQTRAVLALLGFRGGKS